MNPHWSDTSTLAIPQEDANRTGLGFHGHGIWINDQVSKCMSGPQWQLADILANTSLGFERLNGWL